MECTSGHISVPFTGSGKAEDPAEADKAPSDHVELVFNREAHCHGDSSRLSSLYPVLEAGLALFRVKKSLDFLSIVWLKQA